MTPSRKRFFEPTIIVKVDTFSERQERARAALAKSSSQLRVLQKVKSSQEIDESNRLGSVAEAGNAFSHLEPFVDELHGGIEMSATNCRRESPFE